MKPRLANWSAGSRLFYNYSQHNALLAGIRAARSRALRLGLLGDDNHTVEKVDRCQPCLPCRETTQ
ncbi:MAG: hypothetical protein AAB217_07510, partial [Chloroflexota bacterium]